MTDTASQWLGSNRLAKTSHDILIRVPEKDHPELVKAKLQISNDEGRQVTWYEILQTGIATRLAWQDNKEKKKR